MWKFLEETKKHREEALRALQHCDRQAEIAARNDGLRVLENRGR